MNQCFLDYKDPKILIKTLPQIALTIIVTITKAINILVQQYF
jgi:hypothetical protein